MTRLEKIFLLPLLLIISFSLLGTGGSPAAWIFLGSIVLFFIIGGIVLIPILLRSLVFRRPFNKTAKIILGIIAIIMILCFIFLADIGATDIILLALGAGAGLSLIIFIVWGIYDSLWGKN